MTALIAAVVKYVCEEGGGGEGEGECVCVCVCGCDYMDVEGSVWV